MNENKGFTVKCNNCGNELTIITDYDFYRRQFDEDSKVKIEVNWNYEEGNIKCKCDNSVEF